MRHRYGRFKLFDNIASFIIALFILEIGLEQFFINTNLIYGFILSGVAISFIIHTVKPYFEKFTLTQTQITLKKFRKESVIELPSEISIIVSHAMIKREWDVQSVALHNKMYISILTYDSLDTLLSKLTGVKPNVRKYSSTVIESIFSEQNLYGFVYSEDLLNQLLREHTGNLIIPESIVKKSNKIQPYFFNTHVYKE